MKPLALLLFLPSIALAHHGQDFFVTIDSSVPEAFQPMTFSSFEWSKRGDEDELRFESGFLLGLAPGLALGASVGFEDDGSGDWSYAGVSPVLQYRIPTGDFPVSFGFSAKYSFARDAAEHGDAGHDHGDHDHGGHDHDDDGGHNHEPPAGDPDVSEPDDDGGVIPDTDSPDDEETPPVDDHDHSGHDHGDHDHSGDGDLGPDGPTTDLGPDAVAMRGTAKRTASKVNKVQSAESHSHGGIHRHGEDYLELRFIAEAPLGTKTRLVGNLIGVVPESGSTEFGYALGIRREIAHHFEIGLEGIGDFDLHGEHELIAGAYWSPIHQCVLRLGAGTGLGAASSDFSIHTGITWRF